MKLQDEVRERVVRYGWVPLFAIATTTALEAGERGSLSQAVDGIQKAFHVSDLAIGLLGGAMTVVGVLGAFPMGILADRVRRTTLLAAAVAVWTVCMGLNGLATSYALLFLARMGVGAVEANGPAAVSLLSDYYPVKERARTMGLYQSGALAGSVLGFVGGGVAVGLGGYRWAFWMWIPFGVASILLLLRQPEPRRGHQEEAVQEELAKDALGAIEFIGTGALLPEPIRVGTLDYTRCSSRQVWNELVRIPTMWLGVISLTISQLLLAGLGVWAIPYFKRVFHMSAAEAGGVAGTLLIGSVAGVLGGGIVADRYLARGVLCARVYVVAFASIVGTFALLPAFLSTNLLLTVPFFLLAGVFLTVPLAPAEALVSDVVVAELRGRAFTVRSVVRALSALGPVFIGVVSSALGGGGHGLRMALIAMTPLYAIGGVIMLRAVRTYPHDLAFVLAEARRRQAGSM